MTSISTRACMTAQHNTATAVALRTVHSVDQFSADRATRAAVQMQFGIPVRQRDAAVAGMASWYSAFPSSPLHAGSNLAALPVRRSLPGCAFTLAGCALYDSSARGYGEGAAVIVCPGALVICPRARQEVCAVSAEASVVGSDGYDRKHGRAAAVSTAGEVAGVGGRCGGHRSGGRRGVCPVPASADCRLQPK